MKHVVGLIEKPVLVVEDNPDDVVILRHALKKTGLTTPVRVCRDGLDAIDYLKGVGPYQDRKEFPFPRLMIADLKMPRCSGLELLAWLRAHPKCAVVPLIILSTSAEPKDVEEAYRCGANAYFQKPVQVERLESLLKETFAYWNLAVLPDLPSHCE